MEGDGVGTASGGGGGHAGSGNSRWNPTKEQISMLENLYKQGVRTPSAEQIQQITSRLREFGNIEGKNVFYWFQNHKARQRQKQKQESLAYFNRYLHKATTHHAHHVFPPFHPPSPNVVCGPYYLPQNDIGFYQQCPKLLLPPSGIKRRSSPMFTCSGGYEAVASSSYGHVDTAMHTAKNVTTSNCSSSSSNNEHQETLSLFPMHPTGILQGRKSIGSTSNSNTMISTEECSGGQSAGFFDFFSAGQGSFVSD